MSLLLALAIAAQSDPQGFQRALATAAPAASGIEVENLRVDLGPAHLTIAKGTLIPVEGPAAVPQEFLMIGAARFVLETSDPVEAYQIDLFTGAPRLDAAVDRAVLVIPNDAVASGLAARPGKARLDAAQAEEARDLLAAWRGSPEYRRSAADLVMIEDAIGDPIAQQGFVAWCGAGRLGRFLYTVDPFDIEQVSLEQFVPWRLGDVDADSVRRQIRRETQEGRLLGRRFEDIGDWDTWYSTSLARSDGSPTPGRQSFEPERYEVSIDVDADLERIEGRARLTLVPTAREARVAQFELFVDLVLEKVTDASGRPLPWARSGSTIAVVLPGSPALGEKTSIDLSYEGVLFEKLEPGIRGQRTANDWYPRAGTIDRASYKVTFDTPDSVRILGSGVKREESVAGGRRTQVRTLDLPARFFAFEVGRYDIVTRRVGHVDLEVGFLRDAPLAAQVDHDAVLDTIADAFTAHEEAFGPYPLDVLSVAATWGTVSHGYLSFVTLAQPVLDDVALKRADAFQRAAIIAHELGHQWWGNMVGWTSYRDQWLSEALADYSALLYSKRLAARGGERRLSHASVEPLYRPEVFEEPTIRGRPVEAMGPMTLGVRLASSLSDSAYRAIVYDKGAMVFAMLAERIGEAPLVGMLREIAQRARHRDLDTETLLKALEKMSGQDLTPFAREFVFGVGYPEIQYTQAVRGGADGKFSVRGELRQVPRGFRRDRLVRTGDGRFDVAPSYRPYQPVDGAEVAVAALVSTVETTPGPGEPTDELVATGAGTTNAKGFRALLQANGAFKTFAIEVAARPIRLRLDPRRAVPAPLRDGTYDAKRTLVRRGEALRSAGIPDDARSAFREALKTPLAVPPEEAAGVSKANMAWYGERMDGRIHLLLADMALDDGDVEGAERELAAREVKVGADADRRVEARRRIVRARLALRAGNPRAAYGILSDVLALDFLQKESDTVGDSFRREKFRQQREGQGGDYLLLGVAAQLSGHLEVAREAAEEAARRGADTQLLDEIVGAPPEGPPG